MKSTIRGMFSNAISIDKVFTLNIHLLEQKGHFTSKGLLDNANKSILLPDCIFSFFSPMYPRNIVKE